jgi:hypothetical protein
VAGKNVFCVIDISNIVLINIKKILFSNKRSKLEGKRRQSKGIGSRNV